MKLISILFAAVCVAAFCCYAGPALLAWLGLRGWAWCREKLEGRP